MNNSLRFLKIVFLIGTIGAMTVYADERGPRPLPPIRPANVTPEYETVSGSVTVRLNGSPVEAKSVDYVFSPQTEANLGSLDRSGFGVYFLQPVRIPVDQPYKLSLTASYDDSIAGADGRIERRGQTHVGTISISIPYGENYDFGMQIIDLR